MGTTITKPRTGKRIVRVKAGTVRYVPAPAPPKLTPEEQKTADFIAELRTREPDPIITLIMERIRQHRLSGADDEE